MTSLFDVTDADDLNLDPNKNYLEELVGDGKKFKTNEELALGKAQSDLYIKTLNERADEMREEVKRLREEAATKARLEEYIDRITNSNNQNPAPTPAKAESPLYDPKQVESMIYSKIQESEQKKREQENFNSVVGKLKEKFGNNYQANLKNKAMELGLTDAVVEQMARTMPQVLIRSLDLDTPAIYDRAPPRSSLRTDQFQPKGGEKRDYEFYQKLRKTNPDLYNSKETTVQRHKDAVSMGEKAFYGDSYEENNF